MILSLVLFFLSPASAKDIALTPVELAKQATAVIKAKGTVVPEIALTEDAPVITAYGWIYTAPPTCGLVGAATYLIASDGTTDLSVAIVIPVEGVLNGVMVTAHDVGADGIADFMTQEGKATLLPDELTHKLFRSMLICVVSPPSAPKK